MSKNNHVEEHEKINLRKGIKDYTYNINVMLEFRLQNFLLATIGSIAGAMIWLSSRTIFDFLAGININILYLSNILGGVGFFWLTTQYCYQSGLTRFESARLAGRRGLFTFTVMLTTIIFALVITGKVTWEQEFLYFLKYICGGMIFIALFAVPMDYGAGMIKDRFLK